MLYATSQQLNPCTSSQLVLPLGNFAPNDGRQLPFDHWVLSGHQASAITTKRNSTSVRMVVDYEHATLTAKRTGNKAPAAGWVKSLQATDAGIVADIEWTEAASNHIRNNEYKYLSPVFSTSKSGEVLDLHHIALTNDPALSHLDEVTLAAASAQIFPGNTPTQHEVQTMTDIPASTVATLAATFGVDATTADAAAIQSAKDTLLAQASSEHTNALSKLQGELKTAQDALNALIQEKHDQARAQLIAKATTEGKLTPALKEWAESQTIEALTAYLDKAPVIEALSGQQSAQAGKQKSTGTSTITADQQALAKQFGMTDEEYKERYLTVASEQSQQHTQTGV